MNSNNPSPISPLATERPLETSVHESASCTGTPWVGLDIGGANLKAAHTSGWFESIPFPLWKQSELLSAGIAQILRNAPAFVGVGLTMTGELADCFKTRAEGVLRILEQTTLILPSNMVRIYGVDGSWRTPASAARSPWVVAASNWHALAQWIGMTYPKGHCLLVDIGSTTTDLIPVRDGAIAIEARTDSQRLQCGALVYTGIERSNVAAISPRLPLFGNWCPVMNEWFASSGDVHLWLGDVVDDAENCFTADGQPATRIGARYRLARTVGEDGSTLADEDIDALAIQIRDDQVNLIARAMQQVCTFSTLNIQSPQRTKRSKSKLEESPVACRPDQIIVCGHGGFLLEDALRVTGWNVPKVEWSKTLGEGLSRCAPAYAIARLAQKQVDLLK